MQGRLGHAIPPELCVTLAIQVPAVCMRFETSLYAQLACDAHGIYGSAGGATQQSPPAGMRSAEMLQLHCRPSAVPHSCCSGTCACTCCSCVSMYYANWESKHWKALAEPMSTPSYVYALYRDASVALSPIRCASLLLFRYLHAEFPA